MPPINGATAFSGTPYFTDNPGDPYKAWDTQVTFDYMPSQFITFRSEYNHRARERAVLLRRGRRDAARRQYRRAGLVGRRLGAGSAAVGKARDVRHARQALAAVSGNVMQSACFHGGDAADRLRHRDQRSRGRARRWRRPFRWPEARARASMLLVPQIVPYPLPIDAPAEPAPFAAERYRDAARTSCTRRQSPRLPLPARRRRDPADAAIARDGGRRRRGGDLARQSRRAARASPDPSGPSRRSSRRSKSVQRRESQRRVRDVRRCSTSARWVFRVLLVGARAGRGAARGVRPGADQPGTAPADRALEAQLAELKTLVRRGRRRRGGQAAEPARRAQAEDRCSSTTCTT